jgi:hypothetical protein
LKGSRADFRALKIGQNCDGLLVKAGGAPNSPDALNVFLESAVREIYARDVHPRADETLDHL